MRPTDIPQIAQLSTAERILLIEDLWESIAADESAIPVPRSHQEALHRRLDRYQAVPGELLTLEDLREMIESRR